MNITRYHEIENDLTLTKKDKSILFKIEDRKEAISHWETKIHTAYYYIKQNQEKIKTLEAQLTKQICTDCENTKTPFNDNAVCEKHYKELTE